MSQLKNIKVATPTYEEKIPSTKKKIRIKPFRVGDEKVLLLASESKDSKQMIDALKQVITNCTDDVDVNDLAPYDLEYLFVKLRAISVGETSNINIKCNGCEDLHKVSIDLSKLEVTFNPEHKTTIRISDNLGFEMKFASLEALTDVSNQDVDSMLEVIARSVKTVYYGEETFSVGEDEIKDLMNILNELTSAQFNKVQDFFTKAPKLMKEIDFTCKSCGKENSQKLEGLASFF